MSKSNQYSPEVRERAVRMVLEHQSEYSSQWQAICSIAGKIGCSPESLKAWFSPDASGRRQRPYWYNERRQRAPKIIGEREQGAAPR